MMFTFIFRRNSNWPKAGDWKITHKIGPREMTEAEAKLEVCRLQSHLPPFVLVEAQNATTGNM